MNKILSILVCVLGLQVWSQNINPYLQAATPHSIYVNWKTSDNPETIVEYGSSPTNLTQTVNITIVPSLRVYNPIPNITTRQKQETKHLKYCLSKQCLYRDKRQRLTDTFDFWY